MSSVWGKHWYPFVPVHSGRLCWCCLGAAPWCQKWCLFLHSWQAVRHSLVLLQATLWSPAPPHLSSLLSGVTANSSSAWASTASSWGDWQAAHQHWESPMLGPPAPSLGAGDLSAVQTKPAFAASSKKGRGPRGGVLILWQEGQEVPALLWCRQSQERDQCSPALSLPKAWAEKLFAKVCWVL